MLLKSVCITWLLLLSHQASAQVPQAPGDESSSCDLQDFGENKKILLDSRHYDSLLQSGGVWDTNNGVWAYRLGGACSRQVRSCSQSSEAQNNWMFTQHISKALASGETGGYAVNISVEVQYRFSCSFSTVCALGSGAGQMLGVYRYTVDTPVPQNQKNTSLYTRIDTIQDTRILPGQKTTLMFTLNDGGFYLGFRDEGTCFQLERLTVYRYRCPRQENGLVTYPETASPVGDAVSTSAICGAGAESDNPALQCFSNGSWSGNPICKCSDAYELRSGSTCVACGAGMFHSVRDQVCKDCPANSMSTEEAVSVCPCSEGFYRNTDPEEGPDVECTAPPSAPFNLNCASQTNSSLMVTWDKPLSDGGRPQDLFYKVKNRGLGVTDFIIVETNQTGIVLSGLKPHTQYELLVVAENGVSDQSVNGESRGITGFCMTAESLPGAPAEAVVVGSYVVWQPPSEPNGVITGYNLRVTKGSAENTINLGPNTFVYEVEDEDIPLGGTGAAFVQVQAVNSIGDGAWTDEKVIFTNCIPCPPPPGVPLEPRNLQLVGNNTFLTWDPPYDVGGVLVRYRVRIYHEAADGSQLQKFSVDVPPENSYYIIQDGDLPSIDPITIEVCARNDISEVSREWAKIVINKTDTTN